MSEEKSRDPRFFVGLFIGGLIGAIVLFFLGTKDGKKTGKLLADKGEDILDNLRDKLSDIVEEGKTQIEEKKDVVVKSATESIDTALAHIEELQERGRQTTATLRKQFKNLPKKN
ncbi:hypothetical protein A2875_03315 [Candidatus Gottesmanbacteria bacterium RIFCSPHIGHO2_01_FULL_46_14]|nr:MAG: hypothetical protein A2875_03315 [Candidatus Gottesmanbacteria bacterium RIFCSPHIGHO2_01_FULL_46_14]OGG28780.1 MAG: hypothetical protein A2971_05265 [Candidatus Gottesmanbacteria bacterium RIFCSPLOWO2_01_FULL_46_21]